MRTNFLLDCDLQTCSCRNTHIVDNMGYVSIQYSEGGEMKVGIQYFAKGCLYSFYFTDPILSPETKFICFLFFLFWCCLYFPPIRRVNITVLSAVNKVLLSDLQSCPVQCMGSVPVCKWDALDEYHPVCISFHMAEAEFFLVS